MIFEKIETVDSEEIDVRNSNSRVLGLDFYFCQNTIFILKNLAVFFKTTLGSFFLDATDRLFTTDEPYEVSHNVFLHSTGN